MSLYLLMDGSYYIFRAYHALPPLTNQQGESTGVIFGVINMLKKIMVEYPKSTLVVVMDPKGPTFRHEKYEPYKAHRGETPEEIVFQIPFVIEIMKALGLTVMVKEGYEADDVIASLARKAQMKGDQVMILSGDKDLAQMVDDNTILFDSLRRRKMGPMEVKERYGVGPELILDYLTLIGDASDNIPGVPKVGPKTATKWLNEYGSLDGIIENKDQIKGKVGESFREHVHQLGWVKDLISLEDQLEIDLPERNVSELKPSIEELKKLYTRFGFRMWLKEVENKSAPNLRVTHISNINEWNDLISKWSDNHTCYLSFNLCDQNELGVSFDGNLVYWVQDLHGFDSDLEKVVSDLNRIFTDASMVINGYQLKQFYHYMLAFGVRVSGAMHDLSMAAYVLDSSSSTDLASLSEKHLGEVYLMDGLSGIDLMSHRFSLVLQLVKELGARLEGKLQDVFMNIDVPLLPVLANMEFNGVLVDAAMLLQQSQELGSRLNVLEQKVHEEAGKTFNVQSTKQLREVLFESMGLPVIEKTPSGVPSTSESVLSELAKEYAIAEWLTEFRQLSKLKSTYTDGLTREINPKTGRIHGTFNQTVTITGRLSSTEPNLQNIPIRTIEGRKVRDAFVARPGHVLMAADYSQIELRIMAHFSKDPNLCQAFLLDQDVHQRTASDVFSVELDQVTSDQRRKAKAINFGLMYGMSAFGLSKQLDVSVEESKFYIDSYFNRYPGVKGFMEVSRETARQQGFVETFFGRQMSLAGIQSGNRVQRQAAERAAINAPMQGTAADMIKLAMITIQKEIDESKAPITMVLQVHDELVFEVPNELVDKWSSKVKMHMEQVCELHVPIKVDIGIGHNWNLAH